MDDICQNCGGKIEIAIFKGSGYCSDWCKKGIARFRPEDEPIPEVDETVYAGMDENLYTPDVAEVIFEPDFNSLLKVCTNSHVDENVPEEIGQAFVHQSINRICLNLHEKDIWVYDPEWEKKLNAMHAPNGDEEHSH